MILVEKIVVVPSTTVLPRMVERSPVDLVFAGSCGPVPSKDGVVVTPKPKRSSGRVASDFEVVVSSKPKRSRGSVTSEDEVAAVVEVVPPKPNTSSNVARGLTPPGSNEEDTTLVMVSRRLLTIVLSPTYVEV